MVLLIIDMVSDKVSVPGWAYLILGIVTIVWAMLNTAVRER